MPKLSLFNQDIVFAVYRCLPLQIAGGRLLVPSAFEPVGADGTQYAELALMKEQPSVITTTRRVPESKAAKAKATPSPTTIYAYIDHMQPSPSTPVVPPALPLV